LAEGDGKLGFPGSPDRGSRATVTAMPHRPPRKTKKTANPADKATRAAQFEGQRRHEMATRSTLSRFQNRKSEKK